MGPYQGSWLPEGSKTKGATKRKEGVLDTWLASSPSCPDSQKQSESMESPSHIIHINEGNHSTYVAHIWVPEVLHYPPPWISFLLLPWWKRWRREQGLPPSHSGDGQPFPKCGPQAAASVARGKLLAMQILRSHPRLTLAGVAGGRQGARGLLTSPPGSSDIHWSLSQTPVVRDPRPL